MKKEEQSEKRKGSLVIGIVAGVIILALVGLVIYLMVTRNVHPKEEKRNVVVITQDNVDSVVEELDKMGDKVSVAPGYYTVTMNPTWHFKDGSETSYDAVVENVEENTNDVFFDIVLENDEGHVLYKSPVIPRGGKLTNIALDEKLEVGNYPCVVIYHLIDDKQTTLSTLRVTLNIIVE